MLAPRRFTSRLYLLAFLLLFAVYILYTYPEPLHHSFFHPKPFPRLSSPAGTFQWHTRRERYPVSSLTKLPTSKPLHLPKIQYEFPRELKSARDERLERREAVKISFMRSWDGYRAVAWGADELKPISKSYTKRFGALAATLIGTLDTLWIMGLKPEFEQALEKVAEIDFTSSEDEEINVFETTVRILGGLLGAYDVSGQRKEYRVLLDKAVQVGDFLMGSFDTGNRMPVLRWKWKRAREGQEQEAANAVLLAELGSLGLEFTRLSQLTGEAKFYDAIQRIYDALEEQQDKTKLPGMWPVVVNAKDMDFTVDNGFSLGAMSDSTFECLPKMFMLLGGRSERLQTMYEKAITRATSSLFFRPMNPDELDILIPGFARASNGNIVLEAQGQHLGCFAGGMMGISAKLFSRDADFEIARKLVDGCMWVYDSMRTGIMPESFHVTPCKNQNWCPWNLWEWYEELFEKVPGVDPKNVEAKIREFRLKPGFVDYPDKRSLLRPEAIESMFILYRITGDTELMDAAWEMFANLERATKTELGNANLDDVTIIPPPQADGMDSAWTSETLKYVYLILSEPELVSLDEWVFNTQAHPLKRPK